MYSTALLIFIQPGWYLNISARFMSNVLFENKNIKLWNKWHFVEIKTGIIQHVLKMQ